MAGIRVHRVLTRGLPASFHRCQRADRSVDIDVAAARDEHTAYVEAVSRDAALTVVPTDERYPDCVFIEDTVVVFHAFAAIMTRPGAESRRGEVEAVTRALPGMQLFTFGAPATLDGGDVLRVDDRLYVGLSARTNAEGAAALETAAAGVGLAVIRVDVPRGLHLKSACTLVDEHTLIYDPAVGLDLEPFGDLDCVPAAEPAGANVLALGERRVLVSAAAPRTATMLGERGHRVEVIDATQIHLADGGLTCCSVRIPAPDAWCT
jgi:dimethylargininase